MTGLIIGPLEAYGIELSSTETRGHSKKIRNQHVRVNIRKNYFGCRVCRPWNALDEEAVHRTLCQCF